MVRLVESRAHVKFAVSKLKVGMFVASIDNDGQVAITNAGQIKDNESIKKLLNNGIKHVWVDIDRSCDSCGFNKTRLPPPTVKKPPPSRDALQQKAKKLITEAKDLLAKVLSETFEGKAIEIGPFEEFADNMIKSALLDSDALKCVSALRNKDAYLLEHSVNVAFLLITFGQYLSFDKERLKEMAVGGILHDVGKTQVDDSVLHKPGKLTQQEFEHMKLHQNFAVEIMDKTVGMSKISKDVCLMHHEKLDGSGYPNGLKGDELPIHGRMSCIVDIFDALTAKRCYKDSMSPASAFKILLRLTPFHLDEALVYQFIRCVGVYPVGSLVELSDGRIGIVWYAKGRDALHPILKCFYSLKQKRYLAVIFVDLLESEAHIERGVSPCSLEVDCTPFY
ncbi:HD-GYP domain-containing protein [Shewanella sp. D64]|uniref:HD-GYP domain-containing protein n=1 Tax=unclassified Shewanella TaxID=196818 RepID=UPI0022BA3832|nr:MULTISPECIES: HD-GYP domain-containing protein [unclassified Shewanella]MEC4727570.1 HD-GYP domain-containing protein [Shewanella sp. D64]MEC4739821.1 HD-GYP domain-containing protein [Shewanella sp. E94]WBJ95792.1 HD-GYP domain-containing protein [Shewanella sp. MTB7]